MHTCTHATSAAQGWRGREVSTSQTTPYPCLYLPCPIPFLKASRRCSSRWVWKRSMASHISLPAWLTITWNAPVVARQQVWSKGGRDIRSPGTPLWWHASPLLERFHALPEAPHTHDSTPSQKHRTHTSRALDHCSPSPIPPPHTPSQRLPCAAQYFTPSTPHPTSRAPRPTRYTRHPNPAPATHRQ